MRCNRARVLSGVRDELDAPTFRALKAHLRQCPDCASSWIEEDAFRRIVAARPEPKIGAGLTGALLAIPDRAVGWQAFRHSLPPQGPVLALALSVGLGAMGWFWLRGAGPASFDAPPPEPAPAFENAPDLRANALHQATQIPRIRQGLADGPRRVALDPADARLPEASAHSRFGEEVAPKSSLHRLAETPAPASPANFDTGRVPDERLDPSERKATGVPSPQVLVPTVPSPSATPAPTQAPVWELTILALGGVLPIEDGAEVQAEIWSLGGGEERVIDEVRMRFSGGEARVTLRSPLPAPIEVSVYDGVGGLAPCPGESRVRIVEEADLASGPVVMQVLYCYPPRATTAPSATATRAPSTASPAPTETVTVPAPTKTATEAPSPTSTPNNPLPEPSPMPDHRQGSHRG